MRIYDDVFEALETLGIHFTKEEKVYIDALAQIGGQLMAYRKQHKLSQTALARKIGVSQAMISAIERGDKNVSIKVLARIVAKLGGNLKINLGILQSRKKAVDKVEWSASGFGDMVDERVGSEAA